MTDRLKFEKVRYGVCAIGYLLADEKSIRNDPKRTQHWFQVLGTGFLIEESRIITNRHVIQVLYDEGARLGFSNEKMYLRFVYPRKDQNQLQEFYCKFKTHTLITNQKLDIGFVDFIRSSEDEFSICKPLPVVENFSVRVGEQVGVCGYPFGNELLTIPELGIHRFGSVTQQGFISALSPFDNSSDPDSILLDLKSFGGMSGSPIFRVEDGLVIGIHYAGNKATTAFGIPLDRKKLNILIQGHETATKNL